ncbi:hypothetical protein Tco_0327771 [Tanacetum coccineum]
MEVIVISGLTNGIRKGLFERNIRLFGNAGRSEEELFKIIFESIRSRLMGLNLKVTPDVIEATRIWNVPIDRMCKYKDILEELTSDNMNIHKDNLP